MARRMRLQLWLVFGPSQQDPTNPVRLAIAMRCYFHDWWCWASDWHCDNPSTIWQCLSGLTPGSDLAECLTRHLPQFASDCIEMYWGTFVIVILKRFKEQFTKDYDSGLWMSLDFRGRIQGSEFVICSLVIFCAQVIHTQMAVKQSAIDVTWQTLGILIARCFRRQQILLLWELDDTCWDKRRLIESH